MKPYVLLLAAALGTGANAQCSKAKKACGTETEKAAAEAQAAESAGASCCSHRGRSGANKIVEVSFGYNNGTPIGSFGDHTNNLQAANFRFGYMLPGFGGRASAGLEMNAGNYASFTKIQSFGFNGTNTPTPVSYRSSVTSMNVGLRYDVLRTKAVSVFGGVKGGFSFVSSNLEVANQNQDPYGCAPAAETRELISDYTGQGGAEAGANFDLASFCRKMPRNTFMLQARAGYIYGGKVDYINVKKSESAPGHSHTTSGDGTPIQMQFVNLSTSEQHMHEVARVYTSPLQYMEAGVSLVVRF
jgi:hypothetical protein